MSDPDEVVEKERELFKLINTKRGKLGVLTRKRNEIETLKEAREPKQLICEHMDLFNKYLEQFMELQVAVQSALGNEEERESDHNDWYEPKLMRMKEFIEQMDTWMESDEDNTEELNASVHPHDSVSQVGHNIADESADAGTSAGATKAPSRVSVAPSRRSSSSASSSRVSSAHVQAEVARAALLAKVPALKEQHALEREELELKAKQDTEELELKAKKEAEKLRLKARKEALALKTDLAVANAKVSVFASNA